MILKRFSVFYILLFLCVCATIAHAQASLQRGVRISNANGNIVSIGTGGTTQTYSLTLPLSSNPSLTTASLLFGFGTGNLGWTDPTGAVNGSILVLQNIGGNLTPTWTDPLSLNYWSLDGNLIPSAWNGTTGNFIGTTSAQPLVVATTNTTTPQPIEFFTNNAEKMRLSASGNLGINQTNPSQLLEVGNGNLLLSNSGTAGQLQFQGTGSGLTTLQAGAQGATNINYTLPLALPPVGGYVLAASTAGVMSWIDPSSLSTTDWHLLGNFGTTAWNGSTGNFLGTTDAQPAVIATTSTVSPQPIEFFTNTTEKARISAAGNFGINQTNPSQLLEVANGNFLLSNTGSADQLQFQGTSTGITTFQAGAQGATNINYTLPTAAAAANGYVLSSTTGGAMSWVDPTTLPTNDWHILGNSGTSAWNGSTGNFVGTTDAQPTVIATTNTATPQPIEFYTNTTEKARISAAGNFGINQTNPSQLLEVNSGNLLLSNGGTADQLQFQGTSTGITTFQAGAQGATNINYTLPTAAAAANGYVLSSTTGGVMSWMDPTTIQTNDWHLLGNAGTTAWNGTTGNFVGTTDAQALVVATTNTATPQPIEFYTNNAEKMRLSATGNLGLNQTNPSQLLEVNSGNLLLSNGGTADQLQFQGTSTGITTFQAGAQGATNINYTLPTAAAAANGYVLSSTTGGVMSWTDPATLSANDWHILGNAGTTAWNGSTGNFLGTTDAQPTVIATTNTSTPQPIEFFTNTTEKARISAAGNFGINQTNPSQLLEVNSGNLLLSNGGTADQLQFQGTSTGITTFQAGAQGVTNINYTLPTAAAAANGYVLSSTTGGVMSWMDPTTIQTNDWHLLGNAGTTAWNGTTGNFVGTTDAQALVVATTNTATPQPIEFYTNNAEKMRLSATGNLGLNQTNPSQLLEVNSGNLLLSNGGTADQLQFQGTSTGITTFQAGAQGATNINYTLPTAAAAANGYVLSSTTGGTLSWIDPSTLATNDWHILGNSGTSAWNGSTGNFLGTTDAQPTVIATTNTSTPQPIEFFTNTTEKARISAAGNFGINQTNPSQLLEVANGNFLLSNTGSADQLQFQGTSTGITTFQAGAQGATNINYTLPTAAAAANGYVLSSTTGGVMSWMDPTTIQTNDWHLLGNAGTTAWNGTTGNFVGTTDAQALVVATTNTATPQPIEFYTNNAEKMRLSATGNLGLNQTNPSQLLEVNSGNLLLSNGGTADQLQFQGTSTGITTFQAGAQGATNINYTLPTAAAAANGYVLSSTTGGTLSWIDPTTLASSDWHVLGNAGTTAWNGSTGNFLGTTDAQATVIATTNTSTPQPIEFFTNTTEKARISAAGNFGINQTNPSQLLEVANGNFLLSNTGSSDQLQFQGTSTGITTFQAGAQGATNINYTLPTAAAAANGYVLSSTTGGTLSWIDPTTLASTDWHILGNAGTTAWNGTTGNFLGTTDAQPTVIATTNTTTPQPIEFFTNTTEKARISPAGNFGINQTNPSQLLEVKSGNLLLSNGGTADQLQFQGTSTGITTFQAGAQGATNINYTLPTAAAAANGYVLSSTTGGVMSWMDPTTIATNDWHITGNSGTTAWNGATGNIIGTTDNQDFVIGTGATVATREKVRITQAGNIQLSQPGTQLSFLGTGTGVSTFQAGAQGATNLNYTLPTAVPSANSLLFSSGGAASNLNWSNTGSNGQILTITGGVPSWQNTSALTGFMFYDVTTPQNSSLTRTDNLFNVAYAVASNDANASGAVITSTGGATNRSATGLTVTSTATGTGVSTALSATASGGASHIALAATGNVNLLSSGGTASSLSLQNPAASFATSFIAGAQAANINYTLPTAAPAANTYVLTSSTLGVMSWTDPATLPPLDWHLLGNSGTTAWNGATGNFLGTTDAQPAVIATTFTTTPQPIEFFTNTTEKMRLSATGNLGINQTNPSQLLEVKSGNVLLSNAGTADQLQFQGTGAGLSTFQAGAQGVTNLNYTLPTAAPAANSLLYSSGGAASNLNWSNTGSNGQILTITGGVPSWQNTNTLTGFVLYDVTTPQNPSVTRTDNLFNVAYAAGANDANAAGAVITSTGGATNRSATALTLTGTATGTGTSTGLSVTASGGTTQTAIAATGNVNLLSSGGTASTLSLQNPAGTFTSSFISGAQAANLNYTLPTAAPAANSLLFSSGGAASNLNWSNTGSNGQILTITGGVPSWQNTNTLTGFVLYDVTTPQNPSVTRTDNLFNVAYAAGANDANAAGAVITSTGGATNRSATGLTVTSTATGTGVSTALSATASGGASHIALAATGNVNLLSSGGTASSLSLQNPAASFATSFIAGAQAANINYTLPTAAAAANGYVLSSTTGGALSWIDPTTLASSDWHLLGNSGTTAWNGATGNFLGTTDAQPAVIATTFTTTPQPIEFFTNTTEKMRLSATGNLGINQTNPSQLLEVKSGNVLLSNAGTADQLQFQGTGAGLSTFQAGAQGVTNLNYTLPTAAPSANSLLYSSGGAASNLNWSNTGSNGQILTITGGVPSWQNTNTLTGFVLYDVTTPQNPSVTRTDNLFNVAYAAGANDANAAGAVITSTGGATNRSATALTLTGTATGTGTSTGLSVTASGGTTQTAIAATGNVNLLSSGGTASTLSLQNPAGTFTSSFISGAQAANLNYTLPTAAPAANSLLFSSGGAASNLNWSNTGSNGQILTITGGVPSWQNTNTLTGFVLYDVTTPQNPSVTRTDNLFNVAYAAGANDANAAGAVITSTGGATNRSATGLTATSTATGTGISTALSATASGGASQIALAATGNVNLLSSGGTASKLSLQNPAGTFASTFTAGAQAANINYTLPTAAPAANTYVLTSSTLGVMSWTDPATLPPLDWHLLGNSGTTAWNGATGNFLGTTDAQPAVIATTFTTTPQPIEFFTNTTEKMRLSATGNLGINQTNPSQLLEVKSGNVLLSNAGTADQLQFQGTGAGLSTFQAGAQGVTNLNYTLPTAAPAANSLLYSSGGAASNLNWSNTGSNGQILTITGGVPSWQNTNTLTGFVLYDVTTPQNPSVTRTDNLFNVAYAAGANDANAAGAVITSTGGATNRSATGLTATSTATGTGISTALSATASGGASQIALAATGNVNLLSSGGTASKLSLQNPAGTFASTFTAGAQAANINYTLPTAAPAANTYVLTSSTLGVMSWTDPATLPPLDWILSGNSGTTAWNGTTGNFLGTTDAQPLVLATTFTTTPQPIEFFTNTTEKMRLSATGNLGINQTNPSQLLEVKSGNVLLSNAGTADQLQFQGTGAGLTTIQAGAQGASIYNLTLPITTPVANQVLGVSSVTGAGPFGVTLAWQNAAAGGSFVNYNTPSVQNTAVITSANYLYNVAYAASATTNNALGAVITSASGTLGATNATGLAVTATANSTGTSTGLSVTAGGGSTNYAALFNGGKVGVGNLAPATGLDLSSDLATRELNYSTAIPASSNDMNFDGAGNQVSLVRLANAAAAFTITGFAGGQNGKLLTIYNATGQSLSIAHQSASSVAADRIITGTGATVVIPSGGSVDFKYSPTDARWFIASLNDLSQLNGLYVNYNTASQQNTATITSANYLYNIAYAASATTNNALGAVINSAGGTLGATNATGLSVTATANSTGTSTGLNVTAGGGTTNYAALFNGGNVGIGQAAPTQLLEVKNGNLLLSNSASADQLQFQGTSTGLTTLQAGAQGATTYNLTLPITTPTANQVLAVNSISGAGPFAVTLGWQNASGGGSFVNYNTPSVQNTAVITSANYLFNVAYAASATTNNALGGVITSVSGTSGVTNATGLAITATAHSTGTSNGLTVNVSGGSTNNAATFQGGNVGFGNAAPNTDVDITGDIATREFNYATSMSGTKNDVSFDGLAPANQMSFVRIASASGPFTITGVAGGQNGKFLTIYNGTTQSMTIANQNASSTATNRIITGTQVNIPVPTGGSADLIYSATEGRWVVHATSGVSGWLYTGNSGLTDGVNNFHGTLDNTPIRFVAGATNAPSTKMVLDINGNLLFGGNSGNATFTQGSGRIAFGDSLSTTRLASVPTYVNRVFNMIDPNAVVRVWRFNSNAGGTDPAVELIGGTNDNQGNAANHWWDVMATGTPGVAGSGTGGYGEHMTFRRRTGASDSEYLSIFAGGNIGIGNDGVTGVPTPDTRLTIRQIDSTSNTISNLTSLQHSTRAVNGVTAGFGSGLVFKGDDSLGTATPIPIKLNQEMARVAGVWTNAVDASRTGALTFSTVNNAGADAEKMRILGNGNVGIGTTTPNVVMDVNGALATEATNIALSNGTNNNLALTNESFARITGPSAAFTITGIAGGKDGQILRIVNTTVQSMTISHNNGSSTAGNRIYSSTGADVTLLGQNSSFELIYDATNTQWVLTNTYSNSLSGPIGTIQYVTKASDQSVTNSTVLVADNNLTFNTNANDTWEIDGVLHADNTAGASNLKLAFTSPASSTMKIYYNAIEDGGVTGGASVLTASGVSKTITIAAGVSTYVQIHGIVRNGATGGAVLLKWAQGTANAASTILRTDSFLKATRVN